MRHAGVHFPENAGGEHPNRETIVSVPGVRRGCSLICSPSARFHYGYVRKNCAGIVVWRAIPREGKRPAQLGWNPERVAAECLNLWDEQPENSPAQHWGTEHFLPLNELQFNEKENGGPFPGYGEMANNLDRLLPALRREFDRREQNVLLHFPAWVPMDEGDHLEDWAWAAEKWDVIHLHCYGNAETMRARYRSYRSRFPRHPIFVGEWNSNHEGHDERASLEMWAEETANDPLLIGVTYYIWETLNAGERDLSIWGDGERYLLFLNPPPERVNEPPIVIPEPEPEPILMHDPWKFFTPEQLAEAAQVPLRNARANWPRLVEQATHAGMLDGQSDESILNLYIGMIGTIAKESASTFEPVREAFFLGEPEPAEAYRRTLRYYPYYGRGYIQITWRDNYATYGRGVAELWQADPSHPDFDLVGNPDQALDPDTSAAVSVLYFRDHANGALLHAARVRDWESVRRLVLGGSDPDGVRRIQRIDSMLRGEALPEPEGPTGPAAIPFYPDAPIDVQPDDWSCSLQSVQWLLRSIGRNPDKNDPHGDPWLKSELVPHIVSPEVGLRKATGEDMADWLNRQYGQEMGFTAHYADVTFDDVLAGAGTNPMMVGGRRYGPGGHWVGIRRADENGWLELANPAPNYTNTGTHLDRAEWDARGPWSAIWIDRMADAPQQPSEPQPEPEPPSPPTETPEQERARLIEAIGYVGGDLADRLERARASMDDGAARWNAGMSELETTEALLALWGNVDRVYAELGSIGEELRRVRRQQLD